MLLALAALVSLTTFAYAKEIKPPDAATRSITEYSGADRYETATKVSLAAYPNPGSAQGVIVAYGMNFPDALTATALAGTIDCPILLTDTNSLPASTVAELDRLQVSTAYIIGGDSVISAAVRDQIKTHLTGNQEIVVLGGVDRYATADAIRDEVISSHNAGKTLILAYGYGFADSASIAPFAARSHSPILRTDSSGDIPEATQAWLAANLDTSGAATTGFNRIIITGGETVVSINAEGYCRNLGYQVERLGGEDRYQTSLLIAQYCVKNAGMSYSNLGLSSGLKFADALVGGVLQAQSNSVMQLVADTSSALVQLRKTILAGDTAAGSYMPVRFFGGISAIPQVVRDEIMGSKVTAYNITLSQAVDYQMTQSPKISSGGSFIAASKDQVAHYLNPANFSASDFQFLVLSRYTGLTATQLNQYLAGKGDGSMAGKGDIFVQAAKDANINEVYLLIHAGWETGWRSSALAQGIYDNPAWGGDGKTYYNFFGIGAYDSGVVPANVLAVDANMTYTDWSGMQKAKAQGWDSLQQAVSGGAAWIKNQYINQGQDTLYKMRWDPVHMVVGSGSHQYAADVNWAAGIAGPIKAFYNSVGMPLYLNYDVPAYL
jgi:beta-N-acetylglucosaminidase/putative cell wall-binding protein